MSSLPGASSRIAAPDFAPATALRRESFDRSGVTMARSRICCAASIYRSINSGGMKSVSPLVSKPEPPVPSLGNSSETL